MTKIYSEKISCDIFCNVVDNYGDIGVCWRLARQLASEYDLSVRLWVDDVASFAKLCPQADATLESQSQRGVEVRMWRKEFAAAQSADIVIAAFACKLPDSYILAMAAKNDPPVWINLEYLSAENWVAGCHKLPSPHPQLPLTKYFFFPGFNQQTGGLLIEKNLLARRDAFQNNVAAQQEFWRGIGLEIPAADTLKISLFAYENNALTSLFDTWAKGEQAVLCLIPEGRIVPQVEQYFSVEENHARGNLQVRILPFVAQEDYDTLLWACDVNFVRGEDSCVRALWAGKPMAWQIYAQHDEVHWQKLQAFLRLYQEGLSDAASRALQGFWRVWNDGGTVAGEWDDFSGALNELHSHARHRAKILSENNLALNLLDFCQKVGKMRAFKIDGQGT
ncbi:MAG: elongation factor P maturation arginine rhamnosyltransferase EarP [Gallionella sp.]